LDIDISGTSSTDRQLADFIRYREDAIAFLSECCFTLDPVDPRNPIKLLPLDREYLQFFTRCWQQFPLMALPKSRRMTMSWTTIGLYLWDTIFHKGRAQAFVSKKEDDAKELVERAEFMFDHIPEEKIHPDLLPRKRTMSKPPKLMFPEIHSKIEGYPMGANQLRQFTFSGIMGDECAFWEQAQKFYSGSKPTLDGGGRMTLISSRAPGFFKRLVYDKLDVMGDVPAVSPVPIKEPMTGIELWQNPKNKFLIMDIHYTADPKKRSKEFKTKIKDELPLREYLMEYERNWETFAGLPVFEDFNDKIHKVAEPPEAELGIPLLCGWDFGLTPACVIAQLQGSQLKVIKEYTACNMGIRKFSVMVMRELKITHPEWHNPDKDFRHFVDPAGYDRKDTDERTCVQEMEEHAGLRNIEPGPMLWEPRKTAVNKFLITLTGDGPALQLCEESSPTLYAGFTGGYQYPEKMEEIEPNKARPLKNKYSHCFPAGTRVLTPQGIINIELLRIGDLVITPLGTKPITATMNKLAADLVEIHMTNGSKLKCTADHPIWSEKEFVRADTLQYGSKLARSYQWEDPVSTKSKNLIEFAFIKRQKVIIRQIIKPLVRLLTCIDMFGNLPTDLYRKINVFITRITTKLIIGLKTWKSCLGVNMPLITIKNMQQKIQRQLKNIWPQLGGRLASGTALPKAASGIVSMLKELMRINPLKLTYAYNVMTPIELQRADVSVAFVPQIANHKQDDYQASIMSHEVASNVQELSQLTNTALSNFVAGIVTIKTDTATRVYDLTIKDAHCFYAEDTLVSNCHDAFQYLCGGIEAHLTDGEAVTIPTPKYRFIKSKEEDERQEGIRKYGYQ